jgi:hypothetical protein
MSATISGRRWAYIGAALGGTVSIAANIAHSYVPPTDLAPRLAQDWSPNIGAVIGAMFWPVALFVATEILTRVAWPSGWAWQLVRWLGMLPVAAVAALVSYRHLSGLLDFYGEEWIVRILGPLAVDGLMVMATGAILATGQTKHNPASVSVPAAATPITVPAPTPPAVPAPSITAPEPADDPQPTTQPATLPQPVTAGTDVPTPAQIAARVTPSPTTIPLRPTAVRPATGSTSKPSPRTPVSTPSAKPLAAPATDTPVNAPEPAQLQLPIAVDPALLARADQVARQYRTEHGTAITAGQLATRLKVNSELASQALAVLDLGPNSPTQDLPTVNGNPIKATR